MLANHEEASARPRVDIAGGPLAGLRAGGAVTTAWTPWPVGDGTPRMPLVSVVVRNRNYARFLDDCLGSLTHQTYDRFEAVFVDNASSDGSLDKARQIVGDDPRFRFIALDHNAGPLGAALPALAACRGDFVCFLDSDDLLHPLFLAAHLQAHLAAPRNVAFTSNNVIEVGGAGQVLSSGLASLDRRGSHDRKGFRPMERVVVLPRIGPELFETLSSAFRSLDETETGWLWGFGTANMFRRFVIDLLMPDCEGERLRQLSVDGHFCKLAHAIGGSGLIDLPLSGYRIHGTNHFVGHVSVGRMRNGRGPASRFLDVRKEEALRVLLGRPAELCAAMTPNNYWRAVRRTARAPGGAATDLDRRLANLKIFRRFLPGLVSQFGYRATLRNLAASL